MNPLNNPVGLALLAIFLVLLFSEGMTGWAIYLICAGIATYFILRRLVNGPKNKNK